MSAGTVRLEDVRPGQVLRRDGWPVAVAKVFALGGEPGSAPASVVLLWEDGLRTIPLHPAMLWEVAGAQLSLAGAAGSQGSEVREVARPGDTLKEFEVGGEVWKVVMP